MSDSEDDYMSDKLLTKCEDRDIRPGLLFNQTQKRQHEAYKKQIEDSRKKPKTYHEQEKEAREKGLSTAISCDNIGFKLLQKMGYKEGKSLGKDDAGIKEPINVVLKESSSGVGREKHVESVIKQKRELKQQHFEVCEKEYLAARQEKTNKSLLRRDFYKSQRICEELDMRKGIDKPILYSYFWTKETMAQINRDPDDSESNEEEEDEEEIVTEENLHKILGYIRENYWYCLYCCIRGTDKADLEANCPGLSRLDHADELD